MDDEYIGVGEVGFFSSIEGEERTYPDIQNKDEIHPDMCMGIKISCILNQS